MSHPARSTVIAGPWTAQPHVPASRTPERRRGTPPAGTAQLREGLRPEQLVTMEALEIFGWRLAFVRRPLFQPPIPVLFDREGTRHVVILEDGTLDEQPVLPLRT